MCVSRGATTKSKMDFDGGELLGRRKNFRAIISVFCLIRFFAFLLYVLECVCVDVLGRINNTACVWRKFVFIYSQIRLWPRRKRSSENEDPYVVSPPNARRPNYLQHVNRVDVDTFSPCEFVVRSPSSRVIPRPRTRNTTITASTGHASDRSGVHEATARSTTGYVRRVKRILCARRWPSLVGPFVIVIIVIIIHSARTRDVSSRRTILVSSSRCSPQRHSRCLWSILFRWHFPSSENSLCSYKRLPRAENVFSIGVLIIVILIYRYRYLKMCPVLWPRACRIARSDTVRNCSRIVLCDFEVERFCFFLFFRH